MSGISGWRLGTQQDSYVVTRSRPYPLPLIYSALYAALNSVLNSVLYS